MFIIMAINYLTKWIKAEAVLRHRDSGVEVHLKNYHPTLRTFEGLSLRQDKPVYGDQARKIHE